MRAHRHLQAVTAAITTVVLSTGAIGVAGRANAGELYLGPQGVPGGLESARVEVSPKKGRVSLTVRFAKWAAPSRSNVNPLIIAFDHSDNAFCVPNPFEPMLAIWSTETEGKAYVSPQGAAKLAPERVSRLKWKYTVISRLLRSRDPRINCIWTAVAGPEPEHDWHMNLGAFMGRL